jgi:hypothetical protein
MANTIHYVNPGADAGGDGSTSALSGGSCAFQSLNIAENAIDELDYSAGETATINCAGTTADTTAADLGTDIDTDAKVILNGDYAVTSGVHYSTSYYRLEVNNFSALNVSNKNTEINKIQITETGTFDRACLYYGQTAATQSHLLDRCVIKLTNTGNSKGIQTHDNDVILKVQNSVLIGNTTGTSRGIYADTFGGTITVYNCTIYGFDIGIETGHASSSITAINCTVFGNGDDFLQTAGTLTPDYCASDDADGTNHVHLNENAASEWTNAFVNYATGDFHIKDTSSACYNTGTDLFATVPTDIDSDTLTARTDIGADEYTAGGGATATGWMSPRTSWWGDLCWLVGIISFWRKL